MVPGTTYERSKNYDGKTNYFHRRFEKCPNCGDKQYNNMPNFQEVMEKVSKR